VLDALLFAFLVPANSWLSAARTGWRTACIHQRAEDARMANTKRAGDPRFEDAVYFATREVARRLAWLLLIVAAVAALGGRATPARCVAIGPRDGVMGAGVSALAGGGKGSALRAVVCEMALGRRSR
jgi:hypothetical protein